MRHRIAGYGRLISLGNYENERLYLEVEVPDDVAFDDAVALLRSEVDRLLVQPQKAYEKLEALNEQIAWKERRLAQLKSECEQLNQDLRLTKAANHIEEETPF